jgi:hypothetical protein
MDSLCAQVEEEQADVVLERLEVLGLSMLKTGFLEGLEPADMSKTLTPLILQSIEMP